MAGERLLRELALRSEGAGPQRGRAADQLIDGGWVCRCGIINARLSSNCGLCGQLFTGGDWATRRLGPRARSKTETEACIICFTEYEIKVARLGKQEEFDPGFIGPVCPILLQTEVEWLLMPCGHRYCAPCFGRSVEMYCKGELANGRASLRRVLASALQCVRCKREIEPDIVKQNVSEELAASYERATLRAGLLSLGPQLRYCPVAGCHNAILCELDEVSYWQQPYSPEHPTDEAAECPRAVECGAGGCEGVFCFSCGRPWAGHEGLGCGEFEEQQACASATEGANRAWKQSNTKACPKCRVRIEKNEGCNHMTCRWCGWEWCWLCQSDYSSGHLCRGSQRNDRPEIGITETRAPFPDHAAAAAEINPAQWRRTPGVRLPLPEPRLTAEELEALVIAEASAQATRQERARAESLRRGPTMLERWEQMREKRPKRQADETPPRATEATDVTYANLVAQGLV